jgi:hypothetical protein
MSNQNTENSAMEVPGNFWEELTQEANLTLEEHGLSSSQVITLSTPTGQLVTVPVEGAISIRNLIGNAGLTLSPAAQFVVDGTFVGIDHEVAPGGHVSVSVPLKAG